MKTKKLTWAETLVNRIFNMGMKTIYIGCTCCKMHEKEGIEFNTELDSNGNPTTVYKLGRYWYQIEVFDIEIPKVGQPVNGRNCLNENCGPGTLIRIEK